KPTAHYKNRAAWKFSFVALPSSEASRSDRLSRSDPLQKRSFGDVEDTGVPLRIRRSFTRAIPRGLFGGAFYLSRPASGPLSGRSRHELAGKTGRIVEDDPTPT